jgi:hypothetical protein
MLTTLRALPYIFSKNPNVVGQLGLTALLEVVVSLQYLYPNEVVCKLCG